MFLLRKQAEAPLPRQWGRKGMDLALCPLVAEATTRCWGTQLSGSCWGQSPRPGTESVGVDKTTPTSKMGSRCFLYSGDKRHSLQDWPLLVASMKIPSQTACCRKSWFVENYDRENESVTRMGVRATSQQCEEPRVGAAGAIRLPGQRHSPWVCFLECVLLPLLATVLHSERTSLGPTHGQLIKTLTLSGLCHRQLFIPRVVFIGPLSSRFQK